MTVGWIAASMRGRAVLRAGPGFETARAIAAAPTWDAARELLSHTVAGPQLSPGADRTQARWAASAATMWQLRVLAGWVPSASARVVRAAAGPFEIANIEGHLAMLEGGAGADPLALGSLGAAWPRLATTPSPGALRESLRRSVWGDPGGTDRISVAVGLRVAWLRRVRHLDPGTRSWATGALAVLVARERFTFDREISPVTARQIDTCLGRRWQRAGTLVDLVDVLPALARWPLVDIDAPTDVWHAERAVTARIASESRDRIERGRGDRITTVSILALLLVGLWRLRAAIDLAGRGDAGEEVFDAVAQ